MLFRGNVDPVIKQYSDIYIFDDTFKPEITDLKDKEVSRIYRGSSYSES